MRRLALLLVAMREAEGTQTETLPVSRTGLECLDMGATALFMG